MLRASHTVSGWHGLRTRLQCSGRAENWAIIEFNKFKKWNKKALDHVKNVSV
jgi:hypothetical protein